MNPEHQSQIGHNTKSRSLTPSSQSDSDAHRRKSARTDTGHSLSRPTQPTADSEIPGWRALEWMMQQPFSASGDLQTSSSGASERFPKTSKGLGKGKAPTNQSSTSTGSSEPLVSSQHAIDDNSKAQTAENNHDNSTQAVIDDVRCTHAQQAYRRVQHAQHAQQEYQRPATFEMPSLRSTSLTEDPQSPFWTPREDSVLFAMFAHRATPEQRLRI